MSYSTDRYPSVLRSALHRMEDLAHRYPLSVSTRRDDTYEAAAQLMLGHLLLIELNGDYRRVNMENYYPMKSSRGRWIDIDVGKKDGKIMLLIQIKPIWTWTESHLKNRLRSVKDDVRKLNQIVNETKWEKGEKHQKVEVVPLFTVPIGKLNSHDEIRKMRQLCEENDVELHFVSMSKKRRMVE